MVVDKQKEMVHDSNDVMLNLQLTLRVVKARRENINTYYLNEVCHETIKKVSVQH